MLNQQATRVVRRLVQLRSSSVCRAKSAMGIKDLYPIQSVSIPRSGHHMLVRSLYNYREARDPTQPLSYCEYYRNNPKYQNIGTPCCKAIPCVERGREMQKTHDFTGDIPILRSRRYLVQVRDPLPSVMSTFEYEVRRGVRQDTAENWTRVALHQVKYLEVFLDRWVVNLPKGIDVLFVHYDDLMRDPVEELNRVVAYIWPDEKPDTEAVKRALAKHEFRETRRIEEFRFYDQAFVNQLSQRLGAAIEIIHTLRRTADPE